MHKWGVGLPFCVRRPGPFFYGVLRPEPVIFGVLRPTMSWRLRPRPDFTASRVSQYFMWRPELLIFGVLRLGGPLNPTPMVVHVKINFFLRGMTFVPCD